jgi:quinol-cytochrome oxidoreductase complex cytochrome b subunit
LQIITGVVLAMHYTANVDLAFNSVEQIMRDVNYGWLLRYAARQRRIDVLSRRLHPHVPRHVLRLLQGAARGAVDPRRDPAAAHDHTGFMGYVLPWGQMSFWAATVITNLFSAIPLVGESDRQLAVGRLRGRQSDAQPLLLAALPAAVRHRRRRRAAHLGAAHGRAEQPDRHRAKSETDTVAFTPYATIKDGFFLAVFCILFAWFVFYIPNFLVTPITTSRPIRR